MTLFEFSKPVRGRCVPTSQVPGVEMDAESVCNVCRDYEQERPVYEAYFGSEADLIARWNATRGEGDHDVPLMYSGGKDSTYLLLRLLEWDSRVLAVTFDNGFVPLS